MCDNSICRRCHYAGDIAEELTAKGWTGCRKPLETMQYLNAAGSALLHKSTEDYSIDVLSGVTCKEAAVGWVDKGPAGSPSGHKFNGVLMTKTTTECIHFRKNQ